LGFDLDFVVLFIIFLAKYPKDSLQSRWESSSVLGPTRFQDIGERTIGYDLSFLGLMGASLHR